MPRLRRYCITSLTISLLACIAATGAGNASPAEFDKLASDLMDGRIQPQNTDDALRYLAQLKAQLPPGDKNREVLYQRFYCGYAFLNQPEKTEAYARAQLADAQQRGDKVATADFHYCLAGALQLTKGRSAALAEIAIGIALARQSGDARILADGLTFSGALYSVSGEQGKALADMLEAQKLYTQQKLTLLADSNIFNIATAYRRLGLLDKAEEYLKQSEIIANNQHDMSTLISGQMQMGFLYLDRKQPQPAIASFQHARELAMQSHNEDMLGSAYMGLANALNDATRYADAEQAVDQAEHEFDTRADHSARGMLLLQRAISLAGRGHHAQALPLFNEAEKHMVRDDNPRYLAELYQPRAITQEALGNKAAALADERAYIAVHLELDQRAQSQQTDLLRYQFDSARRDSENQRLAVEQARNLSQIAALQQVRRWQWTAMLSGGLLMLLLVYLAWRQIGKARRLHAMAMTDELTSVANRRRVILFGEESVHQAQREHKALSVLTFDIDYFKRINDTHGHLVGDQVLVRVAHTCQLCLRQFDLLGRTGGEEFLVILPSASLEHAAMVAERLRVSVEVLTLTDLADNLAVSISIGVTYLKPSDSQLKDLVQRADDALYRAKGSGRNRVEVEQ